jgi:hypothetical protein
VAEAIENETGYPIDEATVTAYVSQLLKALSKVIRLFSPKDMVQLVERRRGLGYRLASDLDLTIVQGNRVKGCDLSADAESF